MAGKITMLPGLAYRMYVSGRIDKCQILPPLPIFPFEVRRLGRIHAGTLGLIAGGATHRAATESHRTRVTHIKSQFAQPTPGRHPIQFPDQLAAFSDVLSPGSGQTRSTQIGTGVCIHSGLGVSDYN